MLPQAHLSHNTQLCSEKEVGPVSLSLSLLNQWSCLEISDFLY
jgi:hypothetical protein